MDKRKPEMIDGLKNLGDFSLELKWDFSSWVPLVSRILPSDICKISKRGSSVRLDTTLVDFTEMRWERGDITFLYRGEEKGDKSLCVLDNKARVFQWVRHQESEMEFEDEVDLLMSGDIISAQVSTKPISFNKAKAGWIFREDREEMVGNYRATFYNVNGINLETRKRREHLSDADLQKNKQLLESFTKGNMEQGGQSQDILSVDTIYNALHSSSPDDVFSHKESLPPPPSANVTWPEYATCPPGEHPTLGRKPVFKESSKAFKATVAMSEEFPLSVEMLLNVLEVIGDFDWTPWHDV